MTAKKKAAEKKKTAARKPAAKRSAPKKRAAKSPKRVRTATAASSDVVYSDLRRTVSAKLLGRLLGA